MLRIPERLETFSRSICCSVLLFGLAACSIHPLPKDVTGYKTATIVRKIRCEARDAVRQASIDYLRRQGHQDVAEDRSLRSLDGNGANPWGLRKFDFLQRTGIVYSFALQGTETDGLTFSSDIIKPISHGTETFSPSLGNTLNRDNLRAFTVSDTFSSLLNLEEGHCNFETSSGPNFEYPIVGRIGIDEMIKTFVELAVTGEVGVSQDPSKEINLSPAGLPTMVDTITFTTTISAGLTPKIVLSPVGTAAQLMDASLVGTLMRVDKHQVIVGLALAPTAKAPVAAINAKTTALFISHSPKGTDTGVAAAAQAVAQQIFRFQVSRPIITVP
jgi:hypothetical protein